MGKEAVHIFGGLISILIFAYTRGLQPSCESNNGTFHNVGDEWRPNNFTTCRCAAPSAIECSSACIDYQQNTREPGERWLEDPTTYCTCNHQNLVRCNVLKEPACIDVSGNRRKDRQTWMKSSCVYCACINGSIDCSRYDVNITYGLFSVESFPTCEKCDIPSRSRGRQRSSACEVYRELSEKGKLFECASGGFYVQDIHRCNGIGECPDGSDENDCDSVVCKDEEGSLFLIKDDDGWPVSHCVTCHCKQGLLSCRWTLSINFPAYYVGVLNHDEDCIQPQCNVAEFVREKKDYCEGVEFIENDGIYPKDQIWKSAGCDFYFPGAYYVGYRGKVCPPMARPVCHVYNGAICCASECPVLKQVADQMREKSWLTVCPNGRQLSSAHLCRDTNQCLQNFTIQNCSSEVTCQDEDSIQYFEGAMWSVGKCAQCSCIQGKINCSRKVVLASFLPSTQKIQVASENTFIEHCCQSNNCNVANFTKRRNGKCNACRWNGKLYYDGDHWKENGIDFYCSSSNKKYRPGCYVENKKVSCTGAIPGLRELSLISNDNLFLCKNGYEIRSLGDRCNVHPDCDDKSDEQNCVYYCNPEMAHGVPWTRTRENREIIKHCSLINSDWTGTFSGKCIRTLTQMIWLHKTTCDCKRKTLNAYFKKKTAAVNETNFMEISNDMATSAQAGNFINAKVFHDMFENLFHIVTRILTPLTLQNADLALEYCQTAAVNETNFMEISNDMATSAQAGNFINAKVFHDMFENLFHIVTRILTPLTLQNADLALEYCQHVIETVRSSAVYSQKTFCKPGLHVIKTVCGTKLPYDRELLNYKALGFLHQAPKNTTAYKYAVKSSRPASACGTAGSFGEEMIPPPVAVIPTEVKRILLFPFNELNTALRLPTKADGSPQVNINLTKKGSTRNNTSPDKNLTTGGNMTNKLTNEFAILRANNYTIVKYDEPNKLTNEQINAILRANNCTSVKYDEEIGAFVYIQDKSVESLKHGEIQSNMELVLICISTLAIVVALILLTALRLKRSEKMFIHKSLLLSLGLGNLVFVLDKKLFVSRQEHLALCSAVTVIQFFFHTAVFTWMLVEGINLYIKLVKVFSMKRQYATYVAVGWGIPTVIVCLVAAIRPSTFDMGKARYKNITCGSLSFPGEIQRTRCWINGSLWIYKGPILAILVANLVLFVILLRVIFGKIATKYGKDHVEVTKRGLRSIVALLPLLGVTWLLGFFLEFHFAVGYVFVLLNSTQGVLFFIFHCVLDDEVQDAMRKLLVKNKANIKTRGTPASNQNKTPVVERHSRVKIIHDSDQGKQFIEMVDIHPKLTVLNEDEHGKEIDNAEGQPTTDDSSSTVYKATLGGDTVVYEVAV